MEAKILHKFSGEINGVEFDDKDIYCSSKFILEKVEEKFGECYSNEFVKEFRDTVNNIYLKYNEFKFSFEYLEKYFVNSIEKAEKFSDIKFQYEWGDYQIESLNKKIAEDAFTKKKSIKR